MRVDKILSTEQLRIVNEQLGSLRQQNEQLGRLSISNSGINQIKEALEPLRFANHRWQHLLAKHDLSHIDTAVKLSSLEITNFLAVVERIRASFDFNALARSFSIPETEFQGIRTAHNELSLTYQRFTESILTLTDLASLPIPTIGDVTHEILVSNYALECFGTLGQDRENQCARDTELIEKEICDSEDPLVFLRRTNPHLARMYAGARQAFRGRNPERTRHFMISVRELLQALLLTVAPDDSVVSWVQENSKLDLMVDGRITRRGRLSYLCRRIDGHPMTDFVEADIRSFNSLMNLLNRVHDPTIDLDDDRLQAVLLRTDGIILFIARLGTNRY